MCESVCQCVCVRGKGHVSHCNGLVAILQYHTMCKHTAVFAYYTHTNIVQVQCGGYNVSGARLC